MKVNLNPKWLEFSNKVREFDKNICCNCGRNSKDVSISIYKKDFSEINEPYELNNYFSLCLACYTIKTIYKKITP